MRRFAACCAAVLLTACASVEAAELAPVERVGARLDALVPGLLAEEKAAGVGVAVIRDGRTVWTGYYGEQGPGVPVSERTAFNTASIAKTITAETMIALADAGLVDLDEPIAPYVQHPDLSDDPRYATLTARLLMSHRAGLLNWASEYEDGRLAFDHDPDTRLSYSGAGVELAAQYAEAKTGRHLQALADAYVLQPLGIDEVSLGDVPDWSEGRLATPMDAAGEYRALADLNPVLANGDADNIGASDDLVVTVPAYARLIEALASGLGDEQARAQRETVLTTLAGDAVYDCPDLDWLRCPDAYGHSIGWHVFRYDDHRVIMHSGSDAGENAFVYFSPDASSGAVIFVNGANGWVVMTRIIEVIGDEPYLADYYRGLLETVMGRPMPALDPADK